MTIEDLATVVANRIYSGWETERIRQLESAAAMAARQQDFIARQEERERCIRLAQDAHCKLCRKRYGDFGCVDGNKYCSERDEISKAIEKGGNNDD